MLGIRNVQVRKTAIYAIRICNFLAGQESAMTLAEIGEAVGISRASVQQVMIPLLREGVVTSRCGASGGYWIEKRRRPSVGTLVAILGDGICPPMTDDLPEEARIRRRIGAQVGKALRKMKLSDI